MNVVHRYWKLGVLIGLLILLVPLPFAYRRVLEHRAGRLYRLAMQQTPLVQQCHEKFLASGDLDDACLSVIARKRKDLLYKDIQTPGVFWHRQLEYLGAIISKYSGTSAVPPAHLLNARIFCLWNLLKLSGADAFRESMKKHFAAALERPDLCHASEIDAVASCIEKVTR